MNRPESAEDISHLRELAGRLAWYRPEDVDLTFRRAEYADRAGDSVSAATLLASVPDSAPESAQARDMEAIVHRNAFRLDDAERAFRAAVKLDPKMVDAHRGLTALLGVEHRRSDQVEALQAWVRSGFSVVEPLRLLGQSMVVIPPGTLDKTTDEGTILERALKAQPESRHLRPALARFMRNRGELAAASDILDSWLREHPDDLAARIEKLAMLIDSGNDEEAVRYAAGFDETARSNAGFWFCLGDLNRNLQRWDEAVNSYRKAISYDEANPEAWYRLAESLRAAGRAEESARTLKRHAELRKLAEAAAAVDLRNPALPTILVAARACVDLGRNFEARAWIGLALRIDRDNAEARALLARIAKDDHAG